MTRFGLSSDSENPVAASGVQLERIRKNVDIVKQVRRT